MDKSTLASTLENLHGELAQAGQVDPQTLGLLRQLAADVQRLIDRSETPPQTEIASLSGRVQGVLLKVETAHPRLTGVVQQIADGLAGLGI